MGNDVPAHGGLLGVTSYKCKMFNNEFNAGDNGTLALVVKGIGHDIANNTVIGGLTDCLLIKGGQNCSITNNKFINNFVDQGVLASNAGSMLSIERDDPGDLDGNDNIVRYNTFTSTSGAMFNVAASGQSGNIVDNNLYQHGGPWGSIEGTAVASLQEARDAWDNGNDVYSLDAIEETQDRRRTLKEKTSYQFKQTDRIGTSNPQMEFDPDPFTG